MEAALFFWLAGIIDDIRSFLIPFATLTLVFGLVVWVVCVMNLTDNVAKQLLSSKIPQRCVFISIPIVIFIGILPSKNTLYMMAGGYLGQTVIMSDTASKIKQIVDAHLDEQLKKLVK